MKKTFKSGFTLAEVLITLAIIGVVATLTLPSLMSNTQEQQAITGFRKAMNTLNEVAQMNAAQDGFDYSGIVTTTAPSNRAVVDPSTGILEQSIWGIMRSKAQVDVEASINGTARVPECGGFTNQVFFRDGTVLCYEGVATNGNAQTNINAVIDTNGLKAPNKLSTCDDANCNTPAKRHINDQFAITLRGASAIPANSTTVDTEDTTEEQQAEQAGKIANETAASAWAMRK